VSCGSAEELQSAGLRHLRTTPTAFSSLTSGGRSVSIVRLRNKATEFSFYDTSVSAYYYWWGRNAACCSFYALIVAQQRDGRRIHCLWIHIGRVPRIEAMATVGSLRYRENRLWSPANQIRDGETDNTRQKELVWCSLDNPNCCIRAIESSKFLDFK
jgi:hypothetical protein